jgi:hypothetical protein
MAGSGNGLAKSLKIRDLNAAVLAAIKGACVSMQLLIAPTRCWPGFTVPFDVFGIVQNGRRMYSHLGAYFGIFADVDIESDKYRWAGPTRFTMSAIARIINLRKPRARLWFLPGTVPKVCACSVADSWAVAGADEVIASVGETASAGVPLKFHDGESSVKWVRGACVCVSLYCAVLSLSLFLSVSVSLFVCLSVSLSLFLTFQSDSTSLCLHRYSLCSHQLLSLSCAPACRSVAESCTVSRVAMLGLALHQHCHHECSLGGARSLCCPVFINR